jgi:hypothetical protein
MIANLPQEQLQSRAGRGYFWLGWIVASAAGGALTGYLEYTQFQFMATLLFQGFIVGSFQWLLLRPYLKRAWLWVPATGVGMFGGFNLWIEVWPDHDVVVGWLYSHWGLWEVFWLNSVGGPVFLLPATILQWWLLRHKVQAGAWIPLSLAAALVQGAAAATTAYINVDRVDVPLLNAMGPMAMGWAIHALLTGWFLVRLLTGPERR